jgi:hypothetical protein
MTPQPLEFLHYMRVMRADDFDDLLGFGDRVPGKLLTDIFRKVIRSFHHVPYVEGDDIQGVAVSVCQFKDWNPFHSIAIYGPVEKKYGDVIVINGYTFEQLADTIKRCSKMKAFL